MTAPLYLREESLEAAVPGRSWCSTATRAGTRRPSGGPGPGSCSTWADGTGRVARCEVVAVGSGRLDLRVLRLEAVPPRLPRLVLVQALAKGGRDELAVETATELGVDAVVPWQASRSVVVWSGERGERARRKWSGVARAAAKQSRRATVPPVADAVTSRQLCGLVTETVAAGGAAIVLHEDAGTGLGDATLPEGSDVLVVVGPEGGIADDELAGLTGAGAVAVRLGPEVLRTSSAGPAALAVLSARLGRWDIRR